MDPIVFPHLGMTEENFDAICAELCQADQVLAKHDQRIIELRANIASYQVREHEHLAEVNKFEAQEDELRAELKKLATMKAEMHGKVASMQYHQKLANLRIKQTGHQIEKRKKFLFHDEARKRLAVLGKELKLGRGTRAYKQGLKTGVVELNEPDENQTTS